MASEHEKDQSAALRQAMVDRLKNLALIRSEQVEAALRGIPRHIFVPHVGREVAYNDAPVVTHWRGEEAISSERWEKLQAFLTSS